MGGECCVVSEAHGGFIKGPRLEPGLPQDELDPEKKPKNEQTMQLKFDLAFSVDVHQDAA